MVSAEYAMLPTSTLQRTKRESITQKRSGRSTEISRLIGRALRAVINLDVLGEKTITVDCDVLQADGGTRTAAISGAYLALKEAEKCWLANKTINQPCVDGDVAAISVGLVDGIPMVDLDCAEDNNAEVDFNFMLTSAGHIVEIQGSVEKGMAIAWSDFGKMSELAQKGVYKLFESIDCKTDSGELPVRKAQSAKNTEPLFCLKKRFTKAP